MLDARAADRQALEDTLARIEAALRATGKDPMALTVDDLAGVDEFHARGREATTA